MTPETGQKLAYLICFVVISMAVTGYFVGLQSPMNPGKELSRAGSVRADKPPSDSNRIVPSLGHHNFDSDAIPATHYADMHEATRNRSQEWRTNVSDLKSNVAALAEVIITPEQKTLALALRSQNRAFNGAPPTVPHPVDKLSAHSCLACHGEGIKLETMRIPKMSHQLLANCTQCHVANSSGNMTASLFRENSFVGLPAPTGGPRAFEGAPPMMPHSTWMRVDCLSCHGFSGLQGIRTTHPWRQNCQQCHAPFSVLEQIQPGSSPVFLPPIKIEP